MCLALQIVYCTPFEILRYDASGQGNLHSFKASPNYVRRQRRSNNESDDPFLAQGIASLSPFAASSHAPFSLRAICSAFFMIVSFRITLSISVSLSHIRISSRQNKGREKAQATLYPPPRSYHASRGGAHAPAGMTMPTPDYQTIIPSHTTGLPTITLHRWPILWLPTCVECRPYGVHKRKHLRRRGGKYLNYYYHLRPKATMHCRAKQRCIRSKGSDVCSPTKPL